jgi:hypothetical protein
MIAFGQTRRQMIVVTAVPVADISVMVGIAVVTVTVSMPVAMIMIVVGAVIVVTIVLAVAMAIALGRGDGARERALRISKVRPFVLYSLRHTFLTRLGESGCDAWTLARIAGHSSIAISARYVQPSENAVLTAMDRLGGHNIGHSQKELVETMQCEHPLTTVQSKS